MVKDGHIRLLPIHVANKIAAGEVVERPASVVKELIENAIDAGATRIDITVTAGGRKLIEVRDNGSGMTRDDALLSIERQATSKIRDVDDIEHIDSLGFRGEALPAIASVARFLLQTRHAHNESGTEIIVNGGSLQDVREIGIPSGTTIAVRDLFFNVPARRKFMRAYQTEQAHIRTVFTLHALAHPEIGMSLTADGRELTRLPPNATRTERVRDLFGADFCAELRPFDRTVASIRISGFAGLPKNTRSDRSEQYIFINQRPATAAVIAYALREAYPPLEGDRKPIVLLFIELPSNAVDVNVHPTKREVRFHQPAEVRQAIITTISEAIGVPYKSAHTAISPHTEQPPAPPARNAEITLRTLVPEASAPANALPTNTPFIYPRPPTATTVPNTTMATVATLLPPAGQGLELFAAPEEASPWRWCRVLGYVAARYLLLETDAGYVIVEPHAARERVLYERLMCVDQKNTSLSQKLLMPETVLLAPADAARLRKYLKVMQSMGFGIEDFGNDHFIVEALPDVLGAVSCRQILAAIAHDLEHAGIHRGSAKWREQLVAQAACRAAAGCDDNLSTEHAEKLIRELAATRMPYTCPRGKPTMIFTSTRELERKFGR